MWTKNRTYGNQRWQQFDDQENLKVALSWWNQVETDIDSDAWWRPKFVIDRTLFHSLFTFNIPTTWLIYEDWVEVANSASTRVVSDAWHASISSGWTATNKAQLISKRHPRYQPNRWHLFSTAWFLPVPAATWIRKIWLLNTIIEVCFLLEDGKLYAYIEDNSAQKVKQEIDLSEIWLTIADLQYGHLYDIQYQWRLVWDYFFYIDQKLVYKTSFLWQNTEVSVANPALAAWLYAENTDWTEVEIRIWCVDITSEWWVTDEAEYRSMSNASDITVNTADYPVLIAHVKDTLFALPNTRDIQVLRANWNADTRAIMKAYYTRDASAITWASFSDIQYDSWLEFDVAATAIDTAKCQLLWTRRIPANWNTTVDLPAPNVDFYLTAWDYLIITFENAVNPVVNSSVSATLEVWEEI